MNSSTPAFRVAALYRFARLDRHEELRAPLAAFCCGRGIKGTNGQRGDRHAVLKIVMPPKIDDDLADFMETWRQNHAYDPRKGK